MMTRYKCLLILLVQLWGHIQCQCDIQLDVTVFRCTRQKLTEIPIHIHPNTIDLDLSHNLIEILHEDSFSRLPFIQRLTLGNNRIYKITERAFLPIAKNLTFLDLRHNQIVSSITIPFPSSAFAPLINIKHLDLSGNPLGFLPTGFIRYMGTSLNRLDLSSLAIGMKMEAGAFNGLSRVHHLNLAYNTFSELAEESFSGLRPEHFSHLNLDGVHWHCDCRILWLRRWLNRIPVKALQVTKKPGGECVSPPNFKGQALVYLNFTSLQCEPRILNTIPPRNEADLQSPIHVIGYEGQNLTIMCAFISEPKMNVNWYHEGILIQPHWARITQTITPGTKFTTSLHFHGLKVDRHSGFYQCQASNRKGQASASFRLEISPSSIDLSSRTSKLRPTDQYLLDYFGRIVILIGSIVIANVGLILIGFITYKCVKRRRNNHVVKQTTHNQSNLNKTPEELMALQSHSVVNNVNYLQHQPLQSINLGNPIIHSPYLKPIHTFHSTPSTNGLTNQNYGLSTPIVGQHVKFPPISSTLFYENNRSEYGDTPLLTSTPSIQSSDMGYPGSGSSQTAGSCVVSKDLTRSVQNKPYYTLSLRSKNENPELIYSSSLTPFGCERDFHIPNMNKCTEDNNSNEPFNIFDEIRLMEEKFGTKPSPDQSSRRSELCQACPVHGDQTQSNHDPSCVLHSHNPTNNCPIHGLSRSMSRDRKSGHSRATNSSQPSLHGHQRRYSMQNFQQQTDSLFDLGCKHDLSSKKTSTIPRSSVTHTFIRPRDME